MSRTLIMFVRSGSATSRSSRRCPCRLHGRGVPLGQAEFTRFEQAPHDLPLRVCGSAVREFDDLGRHGSAETRRACAISERIVSSSAGKPSFERDERLDHLAD